VRTVADHLVPLSPEVGFFVYLIFVVVGLITFDLYLAAVVLAMSIIVGLSRAVNRLSSATQSVQRGDFSTRIAVHRRDQVGALQRSFNGMAENLERLVRDAAQKEIWERELSLAHELQQSLLPDTLKVPEPLEFSTYFRPSTALGGDYYDVLTLADGRCAVIVADVSGHGLAAGLRMAMVKSAFELLAEEESDPTKILGRLHHLLRDRLQSPSQRRSFVTATITAIDCASGEIEIVNAGHPPTYLLRGGQVTEIELHGLPLGLLRPAFPCHHETLRAGDVLVWLSDGLLEATDRHDDLFGYQRIVDTLQGHGDDITEVRTALLEAVAEHYGDGGHLDDDLTLVVMRWGGRPAGGSAEAPPHRD
jgi:sigma-B regulation protein RsbU (phosphoserine phosphatase)